MDKKNILIFAGAGASKAVEPDFYPTTVEFFDKLPPEIKNDALFKQVSLFLIEHQGNKSIDIELILWSLQELRNFCSQVNDDSTFTGWILAKNRLINATTQNKNYTLGHFPQIAQSSFKNLNDLIDKINERVYHLYSRIPPENKLKNNWLQLLEDVSKIGPKIEIVTTNYDMVIETALDIHDIVDNGWRGSIVRSLDTDLWTLNKKPTYKGLLTKLHGSVNWSRDNSQINVSDPTFKGNHDNHVIIYPGFKGRPSEPTFQSFHEHFRNALSSSEIVIFIGFAFRDEYINEICAQNVKAQTTTVIINPVNVTLPFESENMLYLPSQFNKESVSKTTEFIREHSRQV